MIDQDGSSLDRIHLQARRCGPDHRVPAGSVRDFFGWRHRFKAMEGLCGTRSAFTPAATDTAEQPGKRIVMVDGQQCARLVIRYGLGCRIEATIANQQLDEEFFE
ncbi:MAG: restriction endonuclease [Burkholderiaceae bacterium]